ncbi:MAG: palmitoyltransferase for Vac8p [Caeruleum heppii]|nr:MAG: palmitoyltransferase for Vac8p [Caeruleum heppii]
MATLSSPSPTRRPNRRSLVRRCERGCWLTCKYFPLGFVYGLTTWAVWVQTGIGFSPPATKRSFSGIVTSLLGIAFYLLLNGSYTIAVFTDPGSTQSSTASHGYSSLPTTEPRVDTPSFTVKSTGGTRYCKKCQARKPDRAHHCSSCKRCVLKMDHHCPWLATCVGLRNYKAFVLFLLYTTLFCWVCFLSSAHWVWAEILSDGQYNDTLMPINYIMLAVIAGIIGIVLTGFTAWHFSLAWRGQTTIECLEKTRYLSPLRRSMQNYHQNYATGAHHPGQQTYGEQLREIHTNVLPGVTRPEEGDERLSPTHIPNHHHPSSTASPSRSAATASLQSNFHTYERARERQRYEDYLDEQDSSRLPNAFDLGWRRNLSHLFGETPWLWGLPVCNTTGDGWSWEVSRTWSEAREGIKREREGKAHATLDDGRIPPAEEHDTAGDERHWLSHPSSLTNPPRENHSSDDDPFGTNDPPSSSSALEHPNPHHFHPQPLPSTPNEWRNWS